MKGIFLTLSFTFLECVAFANPAFDQLWFKGSTEDAFAHAKAQRKPILFYWGAVWCPPCNELKAQVFTHPDFAALTSSVVRVYQDGDGDDAQAWSDRLKVSGYPTLLLLSPNGEEWFRMVENISWEEFAETFSLATKTGGSFSSALASALGGQELPENLWKLLAHSRWTHPFMTADEKAKLLLDRERLIDLVPSQYQREKALLVVGLLEEVSSSEKAPHPKLSGLWERTGTLASVYLQNVLSSPANIWAARDLVVNQVDTVLPWAQKQLEKKAWDTLLLRWVRAAEYLRTHGQASLDLQIWAVYPQVVISRLMSKDKTLSASLKKAVKAAVTRADREASSSYQRHSIISGAAWLLGDIGDFDNARSLLLKELRKTDTPWYVQSSLAQLEEKQGNGNDALIWSHLARESAKGTTTRLQWIEADLELTIKLASENTHAVNKILREYYDLAFTLPDGFVGRNANRGSRIKEKLAQLKDPLLRETFTFYAQRCSLSEASMREHCAKHFE